MLKRLGFVQIAFGGGDGGGGGGGGGGAQQVSVPGYTSTPSSGMARGAPASPVGASGGGNGGGFSPTTPSRASSAPPSRPANLGGSSAPVSSGGGATQVAVPGFTPSAIAPTSSPSPVPRGGDGGGGIMSTAATYLPGGINTRNPGSFVNETAARLVPSLPSFGSGVSTERVANPFAGGSDGPSDLELLEAEERRRIAEREARAASESPSLADQVQAGAETELSVVPPAPIPVTEADVLGMPQQPLSIDMLPPITQFQQPQQMPPFPQAGFPGFPQPGALPSMQQPMQQPVTFDSLYGPDFFPPRGLMG